MTDAYYDDASNTIRYKYQYTVPGVPKPSESQMKEAKKSAVSIAKAIVKDRETLESGISIHYDYYSVDDEYLFSLDISKEDME